MNPPFSVQDFFSVLTAYNHGIWPMQIVLNALAVGVLVLIYSKIKNSSRLITWVLAFFWAWMGIMYHFLYFTAINKAAWIFGGLFVLQAVIFIWQGVAKSNLSFSPLSGWRAIIGWILVSYGLVIYPIIGFLTGHSYMDSPTFGLPCPTTIFTFGVFYLALLWFPKHTLIIPVIWSVIGGSAAIFLGVPQDYGLIAAGILGVVLMITSKSKQGP